MSRREYYSETARKLRRKKKQRREEALAAIGFCLLVPALYLVIFALA